VLLEECKGILFITGLFGLIGKAFEGIPRGSKGKAKLVEIPQECLDKRMK
jgi:hypothetical protein